MPQPRPPLNICVTLLIDLNDFKLVVVCLSNGTNVYNLPKSNVCVSIPQMVNYMISLVFSTHLVVKDLC